MQKLHTHNTQPVHNHTAYNNMTACYRENENKYPSYFRQLMHYKYQYMQVLTQANNKRNYSVCSLRLTIGAG